MKPQVIQNYIKIKTFFNWQMINSSLEGKLSWLFFSFKWKECLENMHSGKFSLPVKREKGWRDWIGAIGHEVVTMSSWRQENKRGKEEKREENPAEKQGGGGGKERIRSSYLRDARKNWDACVFEKKTDNLEIQKLSQKLWGFTGNNLGEIVACLRLELGIFGFRLFYMIATAYFFHETKCKLISQLQMFYS